MRRGEEASRTVRIDGSTQVRQGEETFTLQTEGQAELELGAAEGDESEGQRSAATQPQRMQ